MYQRLMRKKHLALSGIRSQALDLQLIPESSKHRIVKIPQQKASNIWCSNLQACESRNKLTSCPSGRLYPLVKQYMLKNISINYVFFPHNSSSRKINQEKTLKFQSLENINEMTANISVPCSPGFKYVTGKPENVVSQLNSAGDGRHCLSQN